jgi:hypothetical protein
MSTESERLEAMLNEVLDEARKSPHPSQKSLALNSALATSQPDATEDAAMQRVTTNADGTWSMTPEVETTETIAPAAEFPKAVSAKTQAVEVLQSQRANWLLAVAAVALFGTGIAINGWFAKSLGATDIAGWLFLVVGCVADCACFLLPERAARLWRQRERGAALCAWGLWIVVFAFALLASAGFASLNIADVSAARANVETTEIRDLRHELEIADKTLDDLRKSIEKECLKRGPKCDDLEQQRKTATNDRQIANDKLAFARDGLRANADPQIQSFAKLAVWATGGIVRLSVDDVAMLRLALMTLLPQLAGLMLMVARRP